jgi:AraC-like DNA-binding protein
MQTIEQTQTLVPHVGPADLAALIERHAATEGKNATPIPLLSLYRSATPVDPIHMVQEPALCVVAQGAKVLTLGCTAFTYDPAHFLLVSVGLPITARLVTEAPDRPYLSLHLSLDLPLIATLLVEAGPAIVPPTDARRGLGIGLLEPALNDAVIRLVRLLETPRHIDVLAPLICREIFYLLLMGPQGARLREIALTNGHTQRVACVIERLRTAYDQPLRIEGLAKEVGMSVSSLHHHFKAVTTMSPLQFQKQVRLQEARRLLLSADIDVATAGFQVGYESPSQFSREYRRLFGEPPSRDIARLRDSGVDLETLDLVAGRASA